MRLRDASHSITGFFFNHNIHPFQEYRRRLDAVRQFSEMTGLEMVYRDEYALEAFLAAVSADPLNRCGYCYASRLEAAAEAAVSGGFDAFSSTLLYSRYQKHETIRRSGEATAARYGILFHYEDFRSGWQEGIRISKEMALYRQQYCGCIFSEKERYLSGS
jgi:predicted adenine nucleotide alpha hydrolase (AANH) superfamily ATPase